MPTAPGRHTDTRTLASVTTTNTSTSLTAPAGTFNKADVGRPISGAGIPAGATLAAVASSTAASLSANATASATVSLTLGRNTGTDAGYGFVGWSPETEAEASVYGVTGSQASPSRLPDSVTPYQQRNR